MEKFFGLLRFLRCVGFCLAEQLKQANGFLWRHLKPLRKFWLSLWDHADRSTEQSIDAWFERHWPVKIVGGWIILGAIFVGLLCVWLAAMFGFLPSGLDETNVLNYLLAGFFISRSIVEMFFGWLLENDTGNLFGVTIIAGVIYALSKLYRPQKR
ncbi:MAG: hypothetical protein HY813_02360 [Candidatus Portnoybacteria bacterium]|nr:hypothetical protein [Candidatus Portnoybacteria bacterium]